MQVSISFERVINDDYLSGYFLTSQAKQTFCDICDIVEEEEDDICDIIEREFDDLDEASDYLHHEDTEDIINFLGLTIIEQEDELRYGESIDIGQGKHRQDIMYKGEFVGFLYSKEKSIFAPIEELYIIPDIDRGLETDGFITLKSFDNYDEALQYVQMNFDGILDMVNNGKWD